MSTTATLTDHEQQQIERANSSGQVPVVFIHGLWLLPSSWDRWAAVFEEQGFTALTPGWPDDPETVEEAKEHPEVFAHKTISQVADHYEEAVRLLSAKAALIGHSFGGLLTQILAGRGLALASVAIDPAPFRGVLPLPISALRSASNHRYCSVAAAVTYCWRAAPASKTSSAMRGDQPRLRADIWTSHPRGKAPPTGMTDGDRDGSEPGSARRFPDGRCREGGRGGSTAPRALRTRIRAHPRVAWPGATLGYGPIPTRWGWSPRRWGRPRRCWSSCRSPSRCC